MGADYAEERRPGQGRLAGSNRRSRPRGARPGGGAVGEGACGTAKQERDDWTYLCGLIFTVHERGTGDEHYLSVENTDAQTRLIWHRSQSRRAFAAQR